MWRQRHRNGPMTVETEIETRLLQAKEYQGVLAAIRSWEEARKNSPLGPSEKTRPSRILDFRYLASGTVREYISALSTQSVVLYCRGHTIPKTNEAVGLSLTKKKTHHSILLWLNNSRQILILFDMESPRIHFNSVLVRDHVYKWPKLNRNRL